MCVLGLGLGGRRRRQRSCLLVEGIVGHNICPYISLLRINRESANPQRIKEAHRRILMLNHPDTGGSTYLASKINEVSEKKEEEGREEREDT